jgi:hypothetical protein
MYLSKGIAKKAYLSDTKCTTGKRYKIPVPILAKGFSEFVNLFF